jgi:hypothetical protein
MHAGYCGEEALAAECGISDALQNVIREHITKPLFDYSTSTRFSSATTY